MKKYLVRLLSAIVVASNPLTATAAAYLCVEDAVTGFDWDNGRWIQRNYFATQWLVRKHGPDEAVAAFCFTEMKLDGLSPGGKGPDGTFGCYSRSEVGQPVGFVHRCREFLATDGTLHSIDCARYILPYRFFPNGEYVATQTYEISPPPHEGQRDSLSIAVGRCSVVTD